LNPDRHTVYFWQLDPQVDPSLETLAPRQLVLMQGLSLKWDQSEDLRWEKRRKSWIMYWC